jgi:hypothetical protein
MSVAVRTVSDESGVALWREDGRPLTAWEQGMRTSRTDVWVPAFGAVYRLALAYPVIFEAERSLSLWRILASCDAGPQPVATVGKKPPATLADARSVVRLALIGGRMAVVDGQQRAVTPSDADHIIDQLTAMPVSETWRLAKTVLSAVLEGRPATAEEQASFSIPAGPPIIPTWALEYRA